MALFGRRSSDDDEAQDADPIDDAVVFDVRLRQERLRQSGQAHTRRQMQRVWAAILAGWQRDRDRMKWTDERTGRPIP